MSDETPTHMAAFNVTLKSGVTELVWQPLHDVTAASWAACLDELGGRLTSDRFIWFRDALLQDEAVFFACDEIVRVSASYGPCQKVSAA